ncbi:MAG TPA: mycothione reductase [Streptosporangiaceae bacterium]|nr:mycothione reductase [Streptosporangiaceae bacterium]
MAGRRYDLVIVGAGSGNMILTEEFRTWRVAVVESDKFGGTCLNRGCIPSKILVFTADVARTVQHAGEFGVNAEFLGANWPAIRDRVFGRIDPLHERAASYRETHGVDVFRGVASFSSPDTIVVDGTEISSDRFILATGSRPAVPAIAGLAEVPYLTSDTVMRLGALPESMLVLGGGYIAAEMSHVFGSLGTRVTIVTRGPQMLSQHDVDVRNKFTEIYAKQFDVRFGTTVRRIEATGTGVRAELAAASGATLVDAEVVLVATGRVPNSDRINVTAAGLRLDDHGHIRTDETYATGVPGIWAFGDLANHFQLKHMANAEARLVRYNVLHPENPRKLPFTIVPSAVFADPQVASVGATEQSLQARGQPYVSAIRPYSDTAYGWALEDTTSFVKVLADPATRQLLGAHLLGPQAATLIQPLIQAMCFGNTVDQVATGVLYIHPALTEVVEQALLKL